MDIFNTLTFNLGKLMTQAIESSAFCEKERTCSWSSCVIVWGRVLSLGRWLSQQKTLKQRERNIMKTLKRSAKTLIWWKEWAHEERATLKHNAYNLYRDISRVTTKLHVFMFHRQFRLLMEYHWWINWLRCPTYAKSKPYEYDTSPISRWQ